VAARQKRTGGECQPASQTAPAASLRQPHRGLLKKNFTHESRPKTWKQKKEVHTHTHTQEVVSTGASSWKINIYKNGEKKEKENNVCSCLVFIVHYHHIQVETLLIFISASLCVHIHNNTHRRWCVHLVTAHNNRPDERGTKCSEKSNNENGGKKICIIIPKTSCWLWLSWIAVVTSSLSSAAQTADS
jgi:hypothetical protein